MLSCDAQSNAAHSLSLDYQVIGGPGKPVICYVPGRVGTGKILSEGNHPALESPGDFLHLLDSAVHHQKSFCGKLLGKQTEGMAYVLNILKEVQMVLLNIQYNLHGGIKGQETVGIFTGFCHKQIRTSHTDVASYVL